MSLWRRWGPLLVWSLVVLVVSLLPLAVGWGRLPDPVATQWGFAGNADASKPHAAVPLLRTCFDIGGHYEFYQSEGLSPTVYSYIVGEVTIELDTERAPKTANSFAFLAEEGFYDNLGFHRIVPGFVNQAGDPVGPTPGAGGPGQDPKDPRYAYQGRVGIDARWEHCIVVVDAEGNIVEEWTQWDSMLKRPHAVYINPYDPERHVWVVDDHNHAIFKFSNDGQTLVQTIGTPDEAGADATHFNRPTFLAWLPDSTLFVADGYNGNRVAKFDAEGNYVTAWGQPGNAPNDTRPGYFNNVHGIATDPETNQVFVNDRGNRRIQVFDNNGVFRTQFINVGSPWALCITPGPRQYLYSSNSNDPREFDRDGQIYKLELDGRIVGSFGRAGRMLKEFSTVHGIDCRAENQLYVGELTSWRVQKLLLKP